MELVILVELVTVRKYNISGKVKNVMSTLVLYIKYNNIKHMDAK